MFFVVWRGAGLGVLLILVLGVVAAVILQAIAANAAFPDTDLSLDLLSLTTPWQMLIIASGFGVSAVATWLIGRRINQDGNAHTLFFIPFQFWAIPMALLAAIMLLGGFSPKGTATLKAEFVDECSKYSADISSVECGCIANVLHAQASEHSQQRFFAFMIHYLKDKKVKDEELFPKFQSTELTRMPMGDQASFVAAFDQAMTCAP